MWEFLNGPNAVGVMSHMTDLVLAVLAFATFLAVWLPLQWRQHRRAEWEAALKQDMLGRGMSAGEIERVLLGTLVAAPARPAPPCP